MRQKYSITPEPVQKQDKEDRHLPILLKNGAKGIRTPDLYNANVALSQLSHSPLRGTYSTTALRGLQAPLRKFHLKEGFAVPTLYNRLLSSACLCASRFLSCPATVKEKR